MPGTPDRAACDRTMIPLRLSFTGARILRPGGIAGGRIGVEDGCLSLAPLPELALPGCTILPGIVALHGDGLERHLAPRRGLVSDLGQGLRTLDAELAASGITTAVLAQFWSWEGGMRGPAFARALATALAAERPHLITDLRLQLRLETHLTDQFEEVAAFVEETGIGYVVLNDHLPHEALLAGRRPPRLTGQALKSGRSPEAHLALIRTLAARAPEVPERLAALTARLGARGVRFGSHDDRDAAARAACRALGADIAEFPETMAAVRAAKAAGEPVILGAPNVVRGASHAGKMSAREAVAAGLCDALVSDYHYPSLLAAMTALDPDPAAQWRLISAGPAAVMSWQDRGRLEEGLRADLTILGPSGRVEATIAAGRMGFARGTVAHALAARIMG